MNAIRKRRSIVVAWLVSYISILLIPMFVSIAVYFVSSNILAEEINKANDSLLKEVQFAIDGQLNDIKRLALEISLNPVIKGLGYFNDRLDQAGQYNLIMKNLQVYLTANGFLDNIYLYVNRTGSALAYNTFIPSELLRDNLKRRYGETDEKWQSILADRHVNEFIPLNSGDPNDRRFSPIAFVKSIELDGHGKPSGNLVFLINGKKLLESLRNIQWVNGGNVLIMDENNHILASTLPVDDSFSLAYGDLKENGKSASPDALLKGSTVSYTQSDVTKWKYISIIPNSIITKKSHEVRDISLMGWLISIVMGSALTIVFVRRNYQPISNLMNAIVRNAGISANKTQNEYQLIQEAFINTVGEREKIKLTLDRQKREIRSSDLAKLMKGKMDNPRSMREMLESYGLRDDGAASFVLLINIEEKGPFFYDNKYFQELNKRARFNLAQLIVANVVEELLGQNHRAVITEMDDKIACLVQFTDVKTDEEEADPCTRVKKEAARIIGEAKRFIGETYDLTLIISASGVKYDPQQFPAAYREASDTMEYSIILGIQEMSFYDDINTRSLSEISPENYYPVREERQLINSVKLGDYRMASQVLDDIFEHNRKQIPLSVSAAKFLMVRLISTMVKTLYELSIYFEDDFLSELNPINRLLNCHNVSEIRNEMQDILERICSFIETKRVKESGHQLKDDVIEFVKMHYSDVNLNISKIGDHLELTPSYLSKLFKEQTGKGLLDYINEYRLEKAKALLLESYLQINEIAAQVGFVNSNTFIRAFKKFEGVTPGNFKRSNVS